MSLSRLSIDLAVQMAGFESDLGRAAKTFERNAAAMKREAEMIGKVVAGAFVAAAAATAAIVSKTIDAADGIRDLALKTGLSTEALSQYDSVTKKAGTSLESFAGGVNKMQRSLVEAAEGGVKQAEAFSKLGLSVSELLQLEPDKQFEMVAEKLDGLTDAAQRAHIGQAIFGRGFATLAPVMEGGSAAIEEARQKAESFGLTIGQEFADNADRFNDNMVDIRDISKGVAVQFTAGLIPALIELQEGFLGMDRDISLARESGEKLGQFIRQLVAAFVVLKQVVTAVGVTLVSVMVTAAGAVAALISPLTGLGLTMEKVITKIASGDVLGGLAEFKNVGADIAKTFNEGADAMKMAGGATADAWGPELQAALNKAFKIMDAGAKTTAKATDAVEKLNVATKETAAEVQRWAARQVIASKAIEAGIKAVEEIEQQQTAYNEALQAFIDIGDPVGAMVREFSEQVEQANVMLARGDITIEQYRASLNSLSDDLGQAAAGMQTVAEESDSMSEAMREGVRILERSFTSVWENIFTGSEEAFASIKDGFLSMLSYLQNAASTRKIFLEIDNAFDPTKSVNWRQLSEGLAAMAGQMAGGALGGGGQWANVGAGVGALAGAMIPGLGLILGPLIGGAVGGALGGLFDSDRPALLQASGFSTARLSGSDTDNLIETIFGSTFLRSRRVEQANLDQFMDMISEFDAGLAEFLDDAQIGKIADALKTWNKTIEGETLSAEQLLESRFATILTTFSNDIQAFVNEVSDLEQQASRLQVGISAESLFSAQPDLFSGRTVNEFLAVVDAMQVGAETIIDTFNRVVTVIDGIVRLKTFLSDFAGSDLGSEFDALLILQNLNIGQQLGRVNSQLMDAVAGFDGSVGSLENIASLITSVREGEIRYLSQLDQIQKGMNASLDQLRADITGLTAAPKTGADIFNDARDLVGALLQAGSAEEVAALQQQFNALIRNIAPEDQIALQGPILQLINSFQQAANDVIGDFRNDALDNAASMRDLVDVFINDIGDPLSIIAATNERAAAALEALAGTGVTVPASAEVPVFDAESVDFASEIMAANEVSAEAQQRILEEGMRELSRTMADGSNYTAAVLAEAIRNGNFVVHLNVRENDLVNR